MCSTECTVEKHKKSEGPESAGFSAGRRLFILLLHPECLSESKGCSGRGEPKERELAGDAASHWRVELMHAAQASLGNGTE